MSLGDYVGRFSDDDASYIIAKGTKLDMGMGSAGMACHNATYIWLYRAKNNGAFPSLDAVAGAQAFINGLIKFGHARRVTSRNGPLDGDVLIFATPNLSGQGAHSCVVVAGGTKIAGYNQAGWFAGGKSHDFSLHDASDIDWVARSCGLTPRRADAHGGEKYIWAVREATAIGRV